MFEIYLNVAVAGLATGGPLGLVAMGFALFYQVTRLFHLAYGSVFTVGAYVAYQFGGAWGLGIVASLVGGMAGAAAINILIDRTIFQALSRRGIDRHVILVSGLGADAVILAMCTLVWGGTLKYYPATGLENTLVVGPVLVTWLQLLSVGGGLAAYFVVHRLLSGTAVGKATRALAADPEVAVITGVSVPLVRLVTAGLTGAAAGLAAAFFAIGVGVHSGMSLSILVLAASGALLGGNRGITGAFVAGVALGFLQDVGSFIIGSEWKNSIAIVVLLLILTVRTLIAVQRHEWNWLGLLDQLLIRRRQEF